jgi:hypothetical protein
MKMNKTNIILIFLLLCIPFALAEGTDVKLDETIITDGNIDADFWLIGNEISLNINDGAVSSNSSTSTVNINNNDYGNDYYSTSGSSIGGILNVITTLFDGINGHLYPEDTPYGQKMFVNSFMNLLSRLFTPTFMNFDAKNEMQDNSIKDLNRRIVNLENGYYNVDDLGRDSYCWGVIKFAQESNLSSISCNGYEYSMNKIGEQYVGIKLNQIEHTASNNTIKLDYEIINQTDFDLAQPEQCRWAKEQHNIKAEKWYCKVQCNQSITRNCICTDMVKTRTWVTTKNGKEAIYNCLI